MNNKIIHGGICTVALGFATAVSVCSCNGDDEYYEGGNYTLARQRMTRSVEFHYPHEGFPAKVGSKTFPHLSIDGYNVDVCISWTGGFTGMRHPRSSPMAIYNFEGSEMAQGKEVFQESLTCEWKSNDCVEAVFVYSVRDILNNTVLRRGKNVSTYAVPLEPDSTLFNYK